MINISMPLIVLNLGGEMMYILQQRLEAQRVPEERGRKVLEDVLRTMFSPSLINELFRPQAMYTNTSTMQLFHKLAHSSIMRLNATSMEKLYDLMTMGVKYQTVVSSVPQQLLHITLNHLETMKLMSPLPEVIALVQTAIDATLKMYTCLTDGHWLRLKASVLRFFQDKKVKVSLFLQNGKQLEDGEFVLGPPMRLAHAVYAPGCIRTVQGESYRSRQLFEYFYGSDRLHESTSNVVIDLSCQEGRNTYCKARGETHPIAFASCTTAAHLVGAIGPALDSQSREAGDGDRAGAGPRGLGPTSVSSAKAEISLLSDLLGGAGTGSKDDDGTFTLTLFPSRRDDDSSDAGAKGGSGEDDDDIIHFDIDGAAEAKTMDRWVDELDLKGYDDDLSPPRAAAAKNDGYGDDDNDDGGMDLLDLMDSAK
jgi:hypothetical protein